MDASEEQLIDMHLGRRLLHLRRERNMTLADLAGFCGIPRARLERIEAGKSRLAGSDLWRVCNGLGIPVDALFVDMPEAMIGTLPSPEQSTRWDFGFDPLDTEEGRQLARHFAAIPDPHVRRDLGLLAAEAADAGASVRKKGK